MGKVIKAEQSTAFLTIQGAANEVCGFEDRCALACLSWLPLPRLFDEVQNCLDVLFLRLCCHNLTQGRTLIQQHLVQLRKRKTPPFKSQCNKRAMILAPHYHSTAVLKRPLCPTYHILKGSYGCLVLQNFCELLEQRGPCGNGKSWEQQEMIIKLLQFCPRKEGKKNKKIINVPTKAKMCTTGSRLLKHKTEPDT